MSIRISIDIHAETPQDFVRDLNALASALGQSDAAGAPMQDEGDALVEPTAPAPRRGRKPKETTADDTGNAGGAPAGDGATTQGAAASGASATSSPQTGVSRDEVAKLATTYGQPSKGGPAVLQELFRKYGSANGKWSEVTDDKLPALKVELEELLA